MGWATLTNGKLLIEAARAFDVFLTVDKNIKSQQNLLSLPLPVIVLDVTTNTPQALAPFAAFVEEILPKLGLGQMVEIEVSGGVTQIAPARPS
jgi:hypothetical protein